MKMKMKMKKIIIAISLPLSILASQAYAQKPVGMPLYYDHFTVHVSNINDATISTSAEGHLTVQDASCDNQTNECHFTLHGDDSWSAGIATVSIGEQGGPTSKVVIYDAPLIPSAYFTDSSPIDTNGAHTGPLNTPDSTDYDYSITGPAKK